jgi:hypothetical protein
LGVELLDGYLQVHFEDVGHAHNQAPCGHPDMG